MSDTQLFVIFSSFASAILLVLGYAYRSDEKIKDHIGVLDDKVNRHINEFTILREGQRQHTKTLDSQTTILKEISGNITKNSVSMARIEGTMERRSEVRVNNT